MQLMYTTSRLQSLFLDQRRYLESFFEEIDLAQAESVLEKLLSCKGVVVLTGIGKSGHIAEKIAATFVSTGTKAIYLSPAHALHGDIGFISDDDLLIAFSKSGESEELIQLVHAAQKKGGRTIAVVSQAHSRLAQIADSSIYLPVKRELCPYNLAPTTSTAIQLIFGDCLAIALMQAKQFSVVDFALNHPAGLLGRKITLKVSDLMLKGGELPLCRPEHTLLDVLPELSAKRSGCLLIIDRDLKLLGIFTDGDLRRAIQERGPLVLESRIDKLMTCAPKTIAPHLLAWKAMEVMEEDPARPITVLPVLEEGRLVGLLRLHDILQRKSEIHEQSCLH